jgi:hypothetical protein
MNIIFNHAIKTVMPQKIRHPSKNGSKINVMSSEFLLLPLSLLVAVTAPPSAVPLFSAIAKDNRKPVS